MPVVDLKTVPDYQAMERYVDSLDKAMQRLTVSSRHANREIAKLTSTVEWPVQVLRAIALLAIVAAIVPLLIALWRWVL